MHGSTESKDVKLAKQIIFEACLQIVASVLIDCVVPLPSKGLKVHQTSPSPLNQMRKKKTKTARSPTIILGQTAAACGLCWGGVLVEWRDSQNSVGGTTTQARPLRQCL